MITKQKKIWCEQEDSILRQLYEQGNNSWSVIANLLATDYKFTRKSAKQCRERYQNHICSESERVEWNLEQEKKLIELHNQIGNKWSLIAQRIPGKTDNCVKNHFYSKLRKILRKLNSVIHSHLRKQYRPIHIETLYKLVEATQQRFKEKPACEYSVSVACQQVQNRMLNVSTLRDEEFDSEERLQIYSDIIRDVSLASKLYKRKSKKSRNSAIQAPNTRRKKNREANIIVENPSQQGYESGHSSVSQDRQSSIVRQTKPKDQIRATVIVQEKQSGIRGMLKDAGILKQDQSGANLPILRLSSQSSFNSYSENNNIQSDNNAFFDDSQIQKQFCKRKGSFYRYRSGLFDSSSQRSDKEGLDFTIN